MRYVSSLFLFLALATNLCAEPLTKIQKQQSRRLFSTLGCRACHDFKYSGSSLAPSLDRIGLKLNAEQILKRLTQPPEESGAGDKFMPSYQTTPIDQLKQLSRFLANRK